ncbi:MAG: GNAT family N-acetyltransferase [Bacteroidota bacterium]
MTRIHPATDLQDYKSIELLAIEIWNEHYTPIIGKAQVDYMLDKFQSVRAIQSQIEEGAHYYVIRYENEDVGYISFYKQEDTLFLSKIYVSSHFRGKGIGKVAMNFIEDQARTSGYRTISLTVNKYNTNSIKAYEKMDFKKIEALVMDIGNGYVMDDYKMEKALKP